MNILGISAYYHDSAAALIKDGEIVAAAQEERFTRKKHDAGFPKNAIQFCLDEGGIEIDNIDAIAFYDKPLLKFERLLETYYAFAPKGLKSFLISIPVWLKEKLFLKRLIKEELIKIAKFNKRKLTLLFPEHHLSHASSSFYTSNFHEAAIVTIDGVGEWCTTSIAYGYDNKIKVLKEIHFPHSIGLLYSSFTYFLGFRVNSGEYKLMGLAPYGNPMSKETQRFITLIKDNLIKIKDDGSFWLNQKYFNYATGLKMINEKKWLNLFGFNRRKPESELEQKHCNLAFAIQKVTEEIILLITKEAQRLTKSKNICLAGGVALNCVANGVLVKERIFNNVYIQPAAGDAGGALGAALSAYHIYFSMERIVDRKNEFMKGTYLGPNFSNITINRVINKYNAKYSYFKNFNDLATQTAELISQGNVIGWFQDKMEFGPRALGNRSILGDARNKEMQKKLNLKIKYRESFRPFAPSVLNEDKLDFFELEESSPYMLLVSKLKPERMNNNIPDNYFELNLKERLYIERSDVPAITHIDFSARIQTVHKETNQKYWTLLNEFKKRTGFGIIVNTSFNVRGEPIVCTPEDAYRCFMRTEMDFLVIENYLFSKLLQPEWEKTDNWKEEFVLD